MGFSDPRYPFVATTSRVVEHWKTGVMARHQPWLLEMQPQVVLEISKELARLKGIKNGEHVMASSARAHLRARPL